MKALYIWLAVMAALLLIGQIRVGAQVEYQRAGLFVRLRLGAFRLQILPEKDKEKPTRNKKKSAKPKQEKPPKPLAEKMGGGLDYARELLPVALEAGSMFYRRLQIDTLELELTAGADDPADAAMRYGQASAALGAFWHPLTETFHVKDGHAKVNLDFDAGETTLYALASLSLNIGQFLWLGIYIGAKALWTFLAVRRKQNARKAA